MQIIKSFLRLLVFISPFAATAQTTYLPQGAKEYQFIDRIEIKQGTNTNLNFSTVKPYSRKAIVRQVEILDSARLGYGDSLSSVDHYPQMKGLGLTKIDEYNLRSLLMNNSEWVTVQRADFESKRSVFNTFYKTKPNLIEVNNNDFFLAVNPVLNIQAGKENGNSSMTFVNSKGVTVRGMIAKKIGFSSTITDNQERGPSFFAQRVEAFSALPGVGFYKRFKTTGYDYFDARGYFTFSAAKFIDFQLGYDKNFIGNGYRSLFLSDYGNSNLFVKINTRIWKLNYQNLFMELMPVGKSPDGISGDTLLDRKYAAMHHLSMNVTKWLNIGLFEGIIFGRKNHFDFQYLNPIIFLRHIEGTVGSPDNAIAGLDFKANVAHRIQLYGQLLLDEFQLSQIKNNTGYWANKYGIQFGAKYIDAFGINNLDLQVESNRVRPFTYSHNDTVASYSHYNQPLAHPLGANFQEFIGILKYQPAPKWYINARAIYYTQGLDSAGVNFGSNVMRNYTSRPRDYGFKIGSGDKATCINAAVTVSYELRENLFVEGSMLLRNFKTVSVPAQINTTMASIGIRWNLFRRDYDY
ncbi:hypothetical protein BH09BAC2_BH09BAC2_00680 [soil metagenome]